jgi:hypothetical protein
MSEPTTAARVFDRMLKDLESRKKTDPIANRGNNTTYNLLEVRVEDWLATEEGRFAHSIKIPNPVPADSGYRKGMTQKEYFEHLCKTEAGEFIFKTADNVEGIYQLRPRKVYDDYDWQHLYAIEDPYGYWAGENERYGFELVGPRLYSFLEVPVKDRQLYKQWDADRRHPSLLATPSAEAKIARYFGYDGSSGKTMLLEFHTEPKARYGFTWRGIRRPHDREMGIAGGELVVLDLHAKHVIGVRRGYVIWNKGWTGRMCPRYGYDGGQDKATYFTSWFLAKVARPTKWEEHFARLEKNRRIVGDPTQKRH